MKIVIAADHGGLSLKNILVAQLKSQQIEVEDLGVFSEDSVDYPDLATPVARQVSEGAADAGVLVCGTGIGMAITANKFKGVRAAVVGDAFSAQMSKEHNNANVIALGGRVISETDAKEILNAWLGAEYAGGRHTRRLDKIKALEDKHFK